MTEHKTKRSPAHVTQWQQLQSSDLAIYAANLRAAGCPAKTVRDILLPLIEGKIQVVELASGQPANIWTSFSERRAAEAARAEKEIAQRQERDNTVKELLGFAWSSEGLNHAYSEHAPELAAFVDYDRAEKLFCIADRFEKSFARAERSYRSDQLPTVYQAWRQEVSEVLSDAEFEEAELRQLLITFQRRNPNLCSAGLSGSELRQLMVFRRELSPVSALVARNDDDVHESDPVVEQQFLVKVRSLLGDARFLDYLKNSDASIDKTLAALAALHLPRSAALQLFDVRQQSLARAQEIRQLPVSRAEKRAQLAALRQSALEQAVALSNGATDGPLMSINHEWLQEIANP